MSEIVTFHAIYTAPAAVHRRAVNRANMRASLASFRLRDRLQRDLVELHEGARIGRPLSIIVAGLRALADDLEADVVAVLREVA